MKLSHVAAPRPHEIIAVGTYVGLLRYVPLPGAGTLFVVTGVGINYGNNEIECFLIIYCIEATHWFPNLRGAEAEVKARNYDHRRQTTSKSYDRSLLQHCHTH